MNTQIGWNTKYKGCTIFILFYFITYFGKMFVSKRDTFVMVGFKMWHKKDKLQTHVGGVNSAHNQAVKNVEYLMNQHIKSVFVKKSN